jgi:hypothetical protein
MHRAQPALTVLCVDSRLLLLHLFLFFHECRRRIVLLLLPPRFDRLLLGLERILSVLLELRSELV